MWRRYTIYCVSVLTAFWYWMVNFSSPILVVASWVFYQDPVIAHLHLCRK